MISYSSRPLLLIVKIEKPQAMVAIEEILEVMNEIMVAQGDLDVEKPIKEVLVIQKKLIHAARLSGKLVINATQMLRSIVSNFIHNQAEITKKANSILDG